MDGMARVVVALEAPDVAEEVLHYLDRSGVARVVGTANDPKQLADAVRQLEPHVVVAAPGLSPAGVVGPPLLTLATRESVAALRAAIGAGAKGFFVWPADRQGLLDRVAAEAVPRALERRGVVVAVHGSRGGVGATFIATHLAQACARQGKSTVLIDADLQHADVTSALALWDDDVRTVADLAAVVDELSWEQIEAVAFAHPSGFRVILAPPVIEVGAVDTEVVVRACVVAASAADAVVVHLPRSVDAVAQRVANDADRWLEVLDLDVGAFVASRRTLELLPQLGSRAELVVNRAARAEVTPADARRAFDRDPIAVVGTDGGAARARLRGKLLSPRGRAARAIDGLASSVLEPTMSSLDDPGNAEAA